MFLVSTLVHTFINLSISYKYTLLVLANIQLMTFFIWNKYIYDAIKNLDMAHVLFYSSQTFFRQQFSFITFGR